MGVNVLGIDEYFKALKEGWLHVSKNTLFKKSEYKGLSEDDCWIKAIEDGWRWDRDKNKFYRWNPNKT
jgi:hypothetical protein